ncbi:hypothetical protein [Arthrobacter sp. AQ5-05]|uniref:hypothetical protein n=1 Tax=Arthrobacter sp. AQ5-05 TaxID=2184581 RepID=UPI00257040F6|nr:hypothetical protein [Arthrobacter sp. AQ5-05]
MPGTLDEGRGKIHAHDLGTVFLQVIGPLAGTASGIEDQPVGKLRQLEHQFAVIPMDMIHKAHGLMSSSARREQASRTRVLDMGSIPASGTRACRGPAAIRRPVPGPVSRTPPAGTRASCS